MKTIYLAKYKKFKNPLNKDFINSISDSFCHTGFEISQAFVLEEGQLIHQNKEFETITIQFLMKKKDLGTKGDG